MEYISLKEYLDQFSELNRIFSNIDSKKIVDGLFFSAIGARICYSDNNIIDTLLEDKIFDLEERKKFLIRLARAGHFSVFSHSCLVVDSFKYRDLFKVFSYKEKSLLNVRHILEFIEQKEKFIEKVINQFDERKFFKKLKLFVTKASKKAATLLDPQMVDFENLKETLKELKPLKTEYDLIIYFFLDVEPFGWLVILSEPFSRIFSHQLVRHTWQNFNQRSNRYTKVHDMVYPISIFESEETLNEFSCSVTNSFVYYERMIEKYKLKKEDARYLTPTGTKTTMISSGPLFVYEDFVQKRAISKAQREIRIYAENINKILLLIKNSSK